MGQTGHVTLQTEGAAIVATRFPLGLTLACVAAQAMKAYEETLAYSPDNKVARNRVDSLRNKVSMAR